MNELVRVEKDTVFLIEDSGFNRFKTKEEMTKHLAVLRGMATQIVENIPISLGVTIWPSPELLFMGHPPKSPVRALYAVLADVFSTAGFSLGVLTTLEVENHEPYDTTVIRAEGRFRAITVH